MTKVLVTGATGFVASHLILALLDKGYAVRGTARSAARAADLNRVLSDFAGKSISVEIVAADLNSDAGWAEAMAGVTHVQHVASPFPPTQPETADELIRPARDGAVRVLRAAKTAGVKRVVLTSSVAAVDTGWGTHAPRVYDETHWTRMEDPSLVSFYAQSKTLAERAAWDYVAGDGQGLELAVINPVAVLGPAMSKDVSTSLGMVLGPLGRTMPAYPKLHQGIVDVRDVARAHIAAMELPQAAGERFIVCSETLWFREVGAILREAYPDRKLPKGELPTWLVRLMARSNPNLKPLLPNLNRARNYSNRKAREVLGIDFIPAREALLASAESAIRLGMV
ncbi:MAG: aldehyde reductase [Caulobacter sp.]|nr:aldehyde reductase [Caulobacter sp.]